MNTADRDNPTDGGLFAGTAWHYARYRPAIRACSSTTLSTAYTSTAGAVCSIWAAVTLEVLIASRG
jgi:hypothetical protein